MNLSHNFSLSKLIYSEANTEIILSVNDDIKEKGLSLTVYDAAQLIAARNKVLRNYGRVELSLEIINKLILSFSCSCFINEKNFTQTIQELLETFYYIKNETMDLVGDDKLIRTMFELFENSCEGSVELLNSKLEEFSKIIRIKGDFDYE